MRISPYSNNYNYNTYRPKRNTESQETKQIRQVSQEIQRINQQTEYVKENGKLPTPTPDFYKK